MFARYPYVKNLDEIARYESKSYRFNGWLTVDGLASALSLATGMSPADAARAAPHALLQEWGVMAGAEDSVARECWPWKTSPGEFLAAAVSSGLAPDDADAPCPGRVWRRTHDGGDLPRYVQLADGVPTDRGGPGMKFLVLWAAMGAHSIRRAETLARSFEPGAVVAWTSATEDAIYDACRDARRARAKHDYAIPRVCARAWWWGWSEFNEARPLGPRRPRRSRPHGLPPAPAGPSNAERAESALRYERAREAWPALRDIHEGGHISVVGHKIGEGESRGVVELAIGDLKSPLRHDYQQTYAAPIRMNGPR